MDEIVTLANYAPSVDEWKKWLAKPQWTAAEAAALSLNISPELTKITRHENSSDWAIAMVAEGATYSLADREMASWMGPMTRATPTFHLILTEKGRVAGISLENQLYSRGIDLAAKALVSIDANLKKPSQWDFSTKWTPSDCIVQMQYWEWTLPMEILGKAEPQYSDTLILPEIALALGVSVYDVRAIVELGHFPKAYGDSGEQWETNEIIRWAKANGRQFDLAKLPSPKPLSKEQQKYGDKMTIKDIADFIGRDPRTVQSYIRKKIDPADFGGWQGSRAEWLTDKFVDKYKAMKKLN